MLILYSANVKNFKYNIFILAVNFFADICYLKNGKSLNKSLQITKWESYWNYNKDEKFKILYFKYYENNGR